MTTTEQTTTPPADKSRILVLAMLFVVYTFNFIDRQIIGILAVPIQEELGANDAQMGLLGGLWRSRCFIPASAFRSRISPIAGAAPGS
jgi:sugar phosphate permease